MSFSLMSQDIILKTNGDEIKAKMTDSKAGVDTMYLGRAFLSIKKQRYL
jgi:hypothetical protein